MPQFSEAVRSAQADATETIIGASPTLTMYEGLMPANCAAVDTGTVLASLDLPANWLTDANSGVKQLSGIWTGTGAKSGIPTHYRIKDAGGACHWQGTAGVGSGELNMAQAISLGGPVSISAASLTMPNT